MRDLAKNIRLPSIDDLFSTEEERQDAKLEKIQILPLSELHPFEGHPFQVRNDEENGIRLITTTPLKNSVRSSMRLQHTNFP